MNINSPFGIMPDAPVATRILADDPDQFGVPAISRSGPSLSGLSPAWGGWYKTLKQWLLLNIPTVINPATGTFVSADAIANGAVGDGVTDDTQVLQQTLNNTGGILFLHPGKQFKITSTLTMPAGSFQYLLIYGGGYLIGAGANPMVSIANPPTTSANVLLLDCVFSSTTPGITIFSANSTTSNWNHITNCFFSGTNCIAIALSSGAAAWFIDNCFFNSNLNTGVALISQPEVNITGCEFLNGVLNPVTQSGVTTTFNLRGNNITDYYNPTVPRALGYQNITATSLPNNTLTALAFDTNMSGSNNAVHSTTTNSTRFNALVAGCYMVAGALQAPAASGSLQLVLRKNGSTTNIPFIAQGAITNSNTGPMVSVSTFVQLAAGDYIEFLGDQNSGGAINTVLVTTWGGMYLLSQP